jgi:hypothetical protein
VGLASFPERRVRAAWIAVTLSSLFATVVACTAPTPDGADFGSGAPRQRPPPEDDTPVVVNRADAGSQPEGGGACQTVAPNNRCGLDPQCGCAANETCDVTNRSTGATSCVTAGGGTLGRPCVQTGDCIAGLMCLYGACRPYCKTARSKCGVAGTGLCVEFVDDQTKPVPNLSFCTINCDPREPAGVCGQNNACHWFATYYAPAKVSDCNFAGTKAELTQCEGDSECLPGYACVEHPRLKVKECERWCRVGVAGDCKEGFECKDVFGENAPVIANQKEGVCQDP